MALNQHRLCSPVVLKVALGLLALCLAGYIVGPPLYWHLMEGLAAVSRSSSSSPAYYSCPPCLCDCSSEPLLSIPQGMDFLSPDLISIFSSSHILISTV